MAWPSSRSRRWVAVAAAFVLLAVGAPAGAAPGADRQGTLDRSVRFLQESQNADGGFGLDGRGSDPMVSSWAAYALASFDINPQDQARPGGVDVHTYLARNAGTFTQTTDFERTVLVALASGTDPRSFGGVDLVQSILDRQLPDGSLPQTATGRNGFVNATIWGVIALGSLDLPRDDRTVGRMVDWILGLELDGGGWTAYNPNDRTPSIDMTGAALEALAAAGRADHPAVGRALGRLRGAQLADGGWPDGAGASESNVASTAWVVQGLLAVGQDPAAWTAGGNTPFDYLAEMQQPDGSIKWKASQSANDLWMTAQVAPALAGRFHPLAAAPHKGKPPTPPEPDGGQPIPPPSTGAGAGQGGSGPQEGDGVIAGGGGSGAPLFSRPKAQSQGRTAGGARQIDRDRVRDGERRAVGPQPEAGTTADSATAPTTSAPPGAPVPPAAPTPVPGGPEPVQDGTGTGAAGGAPVTAPTAVAGDGTPVTGTLIADGQGGDGDPVAAPGLLASKIGEPGSPVPALVLAGLLALCALGGFGHERRGRTA